MWFRFYKMPRSDCWRYMFKQRNFLRRLGFLVQDICLETNTSGRLLRMETWEQYVNTRISGAKSDNASNLWSWSVMRAKSICSPSFSFVRVGGVGWRPPLRILAMIAWLRLPQRLGTMLMPLENLQDVLLNPLVILISKCVLSIGISGTLALIYQH